MESRIRIAVAVLALLVPGIAHAQFGCSPIPVITVPGSVVSDPLVEASVTTAAVSAFVPDPITYSVINPQTFQQEFPGWVKLPVNSRDLAMTNTMDTLSTYLAAATDAQTRVQGLATLTNDPQAKIAVLAAIQNQTVVLANLTQMIGDLIQIEVAHHGFELNSQARAAATEATEWGGQ